MDPTHAILEISSDEEEGWGESKSYSYDWISELLDEVDRETDESDDVVVVDEVSSGFANSKQRLTAKSSAKDADDDDCVILDGDPDNPVPVVNDTASGSDDLLIVGEKGQIACRDFAHSRHLCAKFPFSSTPHERHCDLCHCYVCDSLAPCVHWGTGTSSEDHCHATDKLEIWKLQRKSLKQGKTDPLPFPKFSDTLSVAVPQFNQVPPLTLLEPSPVQNQVSRPTPFRACSSSTNFGVPNIISQGRSQRSGFALARNRFQPHLVSQQLLATRNNVIRRDRVHNVGNLGSQFLPSHTMFKRPGSFGGAPTINRSGYGSSNNINHGYASQYSRNASSTATINDKNPVRWQDFCADVNLESDTFQSSSQPNVGGIFANSVPSQPQVYSQPIPQSNDNQNIYQHRNQTQNAVDPSFSDFNLSWVNDTGQSNQQPPTENSQLQSLPTYEPSPVAELDPQFSGSTNPGSSDFQFPNWILEDQPVLGTPESSVPPELHIPAPEPATIDTGMLLFDFETSWNSLARV